jgi:uncharacterized paraquat-inducible protein A
MYCPACGIDSVEGLKYCKRCGASLTSSELVPARRPVSLIALFLVVIAGIAALGLSLPLTMARDLLNAGFRTKEIMFFFFGGAICTVMIIKILSQVLMKMIESNKYERANIGQPRPVTYEPHQLAQPLPIGSVTENTTRSFDQRRFDDARFEGR